MVEEVKIAIVGAGPAGLSAAARAARTETSHVLLDRSPHIADTIHRYQRGKYVMATPETLPLRADLSFEASRRETVLKRWWDESQKHGINIELESDVTGIAGERGAFDVDLRDGRRYRAEAVVLAIGLQGNINKLPVPGADRYLVQYHLDDPDDYRNERIIVLGAGDAGVENALALAPHNDVTIINRDTEFARCKTGNLNLISASIERGDLKCLYRTSPVEVTETGLRIQTEEGDGFLPCERIIARLGASPPRKFVEACGVEFPSAERHALPEVSETYESNVPGLYIIGALGGFPLIKQAMNHGFEVVETINGRSVKPADDPILEEIFAPLRPMSVTEALQAIKSRLAVFSDVNTLKLRELMLASRVCHLNPGDLVFRVNDYTNTFFSIYSGSVLVGDSEVELKQGDFFGEMGLISGRRRSATITAGPEGCVLVETPRREMLTLIKSQPEVKRALDSKAIVRQIRTHLAPEARDEDLRDVLASATLRSFRRGDVLFQQGEAGDAMYLIRRGSVTVARDIGGSETVLAYVPAGNYVGEMALLSDAPRNATVRAAIATEAIRIEAEPFKRFLEATPALRRRLEKTYRDRLVESERMLARPQAGSIIQFLVDQGVGEASDVLLIDDSLCIGCDNCEKACAETHNGISRLNRAAGPTFATVHVPTSCRHCEHPHCMADCPPDAIHRAPDGEVFIDDSCIGCGNCVTNCPYDVIRMAAPPDKRPNLLTWLLFGHGPAPGEAREGEGGETGRKVAVKCDMCVGLGHGPACVSACPTGAAIRVSPEEFLTLASLGRRSGA